MSMLSMPLVTSEVVDGVTVYTVIPVDPTELGRIKKLVVAIDPDPGIDFVDAQCRFFGIVGAKEGYAS